MLQVKCSGEEFDTKLIETDPTALPMSVQVCQLVPNAEVECTVAGFTSNDQVFHKGPSSSPVTTFTHQERECC